MLANIEIYVASGSVIRVPSHYRVRARNARVRAMHTPTQKQLYKNEAVELRTIAIITRFFGGLLN